MALDFIRRNLDALKAHPESGCVGGGGTGPRRTSVPAGSDWPCRRPLASGDAVSGLAVWQATWILWPSGPIASPSFEEVGGLDEALVRNQDDELNYRLTEAGWRIWFDLESAPHTMLGRVSEAVQSIPPIRVLEGLRQPQASDCHDLAPAGARRFSRCASGSDRGFSLDVVVAQGGRLAVPGSACAADGAGGLVARCTGFGDAVRGAGPRHSLGVIRSFLVLHVAYGWGYWQGIWRFFCFDDPPEAAFKTLTPMTDAAMQGQSSGPGVC